jgi:hypothetical protein
MSRVKKGCLDVERDASPHKAMPRRTKGCLGAQRDASARGGREARRETGEGRPRGAEAARGWGRSTGGTRATPRRLRLVGL